MALLATQSAQFFQRGISAALILALGACVPFHDGDLFENLRGQWHAEKPAAEVTRTAKATPIAKATPAASPRKAAPPRKSALAVKRGDTYFSLARRHNVSLKALLKANNARPPYTLTPGSQLRLPPETFHRVSKNDTLYAIARRYGVSVTVLARHNKIKSPFIVQPDMRLAIPNPRGLPRPKTAQATPSKPTPPPAAKRQGRFIKPLNGRVVSDYGPKNGGQHNDGINIAAPRGTPVKASENGIIVYAGNELKGYGNLVLIRHADGWLSAYAHLDAFRVRAGERVKQGAIIGGVGTSGGVGEPQLHFEIRKGSRTVNPSAHIS